MTSWISRFSVEALLWISGLLYLALWVDPFAGTQLNLCLVSLLGLGHCPGCGLGLSIAFFFRGEFAQSFAVHPLGGLVVCVLFWRIVSLLKMQWGRAVPPTVG